MDEHELCVVALTIIVEVLELVENAAGEGAAEVAHEDEDEGLVASCFGEALVVAENVAFGGLGDGVGFFAGGWASEFCLQGSPEDHAEGGPPDDVVKEGDPDPRDGEWFFEGGEGEADGDGGFDKEADEDEGPVSEWLARRDEEPDALGDEDDADDLAKEEGGVAENAGAFEAVLW